ncbi:unnamed protein product [Boreogadus saida]
MRRRTLEQVGRDATVRGEWYAENVRRLTLAARFDDPRLRGYVSAGFHGDDGIDASAGLTAAPAPQPPPSSPSSTTTATPQYQSAEGGRSAGAYRTFGGSTAAVNPTLRRGVTRKEGRRSDDKAGRATPPHTPNGGS